MNIPLFQRLVVRSLAALLLGSVLAGVSQAAPQPTSTPMSTPMSTRGESLDRVVAVVNDGVVLRSELERETSRIRDRLAQEKTAAPPDNILNQQVLDRLILEELQLQHARRGGLQVTDDMVNSALNDIATRNNIPFNNLPAAIEAQGQNYAQYREQVRHDMTLQILQQQAVVANIVVTPRELDQFVAKQQRLPDAQAEYNLSHILIAVASNSTPEQLAQREARAREVLAKLKAGGSFAELAVSYSDSSTNVQGGALGWRGGAQLPSIVADKIPELKTGDTTDIIRTPSGFHIFKLNDKRGGSGDEQMQVQRHARHILLKTSEVEDDNTVKQRLEKIRARIVGGESFAAIAAVTSQDTGSAVEGGDLGWAGKGTFVPEFEAVLDQLHDNELSEPFKSQYGWHIVQLLGTRTQNITDDIRRGKAMNALRSAKADEAVELWLRELRAGAYVEVLL